MSATPAPHRVAVMFLALIAIALAGHPAILLAGGKPAAPEAAAADGAASRGAELAALCTSCHGRDGRSNISRFPSIAGLEPEVFTARMQALKAGERGHLLKRMTRDLSDQDIADLAAHFATLE
ncbi:c-type cytochrome [Halomonas alkalicola]|uniref:c-type cytochrome n=1 Tax=Halomonas alkalicola TaxID=1930622 RepID=UPI00265E8C74|nr:c-type cytochrome [Halomonas alkalicola]